MVLEIETLRIGPKDAQTPRVQDEGRMFPVRRTGDIMPDARCHETVTTIGTKQSCNQWGPETVISGALLGTPSIVTTSG
jgi:hypothetical protein